MGQDHNFKLGDKVTFTNDYGVVFKGHTIIGFRESDPDFLPDRTIYIDTDCHHFPKRPDQLRLETEI